jgi:hypothetical protein
MGDAISQRPSGRDISLALAECVIVSALFVADAYHHIFFSKTPYLFLLGWASIRWRGMRWKDVGFAWPSNWKAALLVGVLCGLFIEAFELFISQPLLARWMGKMPDLSNFSAVHGNLKVTLIYILLIWMLAAFGEELASLSWVPNESSGWIVSRYTRGMGSESVGNKRSSLRMFPYWSRSHRNAGKYLGWPAARGRVFGVRAQPDCRDCHTRSH